MGGFTQSALLKALGWSLFDSLWQMALLWICYLLLVSAWSKMSAHIRHNLASLLTGIGTAGFLLSFIIHYYAATEAPALSAWISGLVLTAQQAGYVFPEAARSMDRLLPYCSCLYLVILACLFARYGHHYLYSRRLKEERLSTTGAGLEVFVARTAGRMGIKKAVGVWLSPMVNVPVTFGFLRPVILIPFAMINSLSLEQVEAILLHELAHIRRNDYLLNLVVSIMQLLFFFNPFATLLIRTIKKEREHRCDDLVIRFHYDPHAYASALLSLATASRHRQTLALAATGKNDRVLLHRVKRILQQETRADQRSPGSLFLFVFTALTVLCMLPHAPETRPLADTGTLSAARLATRPFTSVQRPSAVKWISREILASSSILSQGPKITVKAGPGKPAGPKERYEPKKQHRPLIDEGDQSSDQDQDISVADNGFQDNEKTYPAIHWPTAFNISFAGDVASSDRFNAGLSSPRKADSSEASRLLAELTDPKSSASEVRAKIIRAIAANEVTLAKAREMLKANNLAIGELAPANLRPAQNPQRRSLEQKAHTLREQLLQQQGMKIILERAAKRLTIVYI